MVHATSDVKVPALGWRIAQSVALLFGFYVVTIGAAAILFVAPFFVLKAEHVTFQLLLAFPCGSIPAWLLLKGVLGARRPDFVPPGKALARDEAPELFAIIEELASRAKTRPPVEVYLSSGPTVGVGEIGGFFGFGSRRVLLLGVPVVECLTVQELRSPLAHELGHYLGGDTRLSGVISFTSAAFRSVLGATVSTDPKPRHVVIAVGLDMAKMIGRAIVGTYARFYFRITRRSSRRLELAADALAARLAGRAASIRALEKLTVFALMYQAYVDSYVAQAITTFGVVPSDLVAGFRAFSSRIRGRGLEQKLAEAVRTQETDPFDTHPALAERVRAFMDLPEGPVDEDERPAADLFADPKALEAWLVQATVEHFTSSGLQLGAVRPKRWARIAATSLTKHERERTATVAPVLRPLHPDAATSGALFSAVVGGISNDGIYRLACHIEPALARLQPPHGPSVIHVASVALTALFQHALLEQGATVEPSLGEPCLVLRYLDERVPVAELVEEAMTSSEGAATLVAWAERLEAAERASVAMTA